MTFNEKIDLFMEENDIPNLKQFAILAGIPYTTLRDFYEKKSADNSRLSTIRKLSQYMNCTMDYLAYDNVLTANPVPATDDITYNKLIKHLTQNRAILTTGDLTVINTIIEQRKKETN